MTFGLGYFEDGVWVDHRAADSSGVLDPVHEDLREHDADPIHAIHQWLSCCVDTEEPEIAPDHPDGSVPAVGIVLRAVAGTAQR